MGRKCVGGAPINLVNQSDYKKASKAAVTSEVQAEAAGQKEKASSSVVTKVVIGGGITLLFVMFGFILYKLR